MPGVAVAGLARRPQSGGEPDKAGKRLVRLSCKTCNLNFVLETYIFIFVTVQFIFTTDVYLHISVSVKISPSSYSFMLCQTSFHSGSVEGKCCVRTRRPFGRRQPRRPREHLPCCSRPRRGCGCKAAGQSVEVAGVMEGYLNTEECAFYILCCDTHGSIERDFCRTLILA